MFKRPPVGATAKIMLNGNNLIAGDWLPGSSTFENTPVSGPAETFAAGNPALIDRAAAAAEEAFWSYGHALRSTRAAFLRCIADEVDARGDDITAIGTRETGLPESRLAGERARTTMQLRLFADHIETGAYLDRRHDPALPDRKPLPRPEIRLIQRPVGPVAVFGASNFPLAFSVAGGDTAAALAAGCPVVVKAHTAHPGVSDMVAQCVDAARRRVELHPGVFSMVHGGSHAVGQALVQHPTIRAVGFTGSLKGGRKLFDLCAARQDPIPFFGELGSVNPVFILDAALAKRGAEIAEAWAGSLTMGAGQFCTKPGIAIVVEGSDAAAFISAARRALASVPIQSMLTQGISDAYDSGRKSFAEVEGVQEVLGAASKPRMASPALLVTDGRTWLQHDVLAEEVFGPLGLVVQVRDNTERARIAKALQGQLTCTLHIDAGDVETARQLMSVLERKAGRLICNGFPTGVEVCDAMVHGGPYPASTNFGATSVGTMSIRRFLRPVSYQNIPRELLPLELAEDLT